MLKGIDVSEYNGNIDFDKLKVDFVVLRSIKKNGKADAAFDRNVEGCRKHKIPFSIYKYTYAQTILAAEAEAAMVADLCSRSGIKPIVWWDVEDASLRALGAEKLTSLILAAKKVIEDAGLEFGIYTGMSFYNERRFVPEKLPVKYWIARYPNSKYYSLSDEVPMLNKPTIKGMVAWQYTSKGQVEGIKGAVDLNCCEDPFWTADAAPAYYGLPSVSEVFKACGIPYTYEERKKIAAANGLSGYSGTVEQNMWLMALLIQGNLKRIA